MTRKETNKYQRAWKAKNREKCNAYQAKWVASHRVEWNAYVKARYWAAKKILKPRPAQPDRRHGI